MSSVDAFREKIDGVRFAVNAGVLSREQVLEALTLDTSSFDSDRLVSFEEHRGGAVHVCPWHTCQATRHG